MSQNQTNHDMNIHNRSEKNSRMKTPVPKGFARGVPVLLLALSVFLTLCFITQGTGTMGRFISGFLLGLFSYGGYILPLLIAVHAIFYYSDLYNHRRLTRLIFSAVTLVGISSLIYVIRFWGVDLPFTFVKYYTDGTAGAGLIGSVIAYALMKIIGPVGVIILTLAIFALYMIYFFGKGHSAFVTIGLKLLSWIMSFFSFVEKKILRIKKKKKSKAMRNLGSELSDDEYFAVDNGLQKLAIPELGILEVKNSRSIEENPTLHERVYPKKAKKENVEKGFRAAEEAAESAHGIFFASEEDSAMNSMLRKEKTDGVIYDTPFEETRRTTGHASQATYTADDSAEAVFTKDFDPFNITLNTSLASKRSSHAAEMESGGFKTEEDALPSTPEEAEERLRRIEFEKKKQQLMEERKRRIEAFEAARAASAAAAEKEEKKSEPEEELADRVERAAMQAPTITYAPEDAPEAPVRTVPLEEPPRKSIEFHEQKPHSFNESAPRVEEEMNARLEKPAQAPVYPTQNPTYQNPYPPTQNPMGTPPPVFCINCVVFGSEAETVYYTRSDCGNY